ncbi:MAG: heterodisulfide reductase-related iron-sulfur binding cluster, partial [Candidatus Cryptobacteroides sp.]
KAVLVFRNDYRRRIAYHTPCHMEKLGWSIYSTSLLKMIPGLDFVMLDSQCCGIAGTFGFKKENYPYSQKIGEGLFRQISEVGPDMVATDCETCKWQIEMSTGVKVENPISIIADALDVEATMRANAGPDADGTK